MKFKKTLFIIVLAISGQFLSGLSAFAQDQDEEKTYTSQEHDFRLVPVVEELEFPWAVAFLPNGDYLITQRGGELIRASGQDGEKVKIEGLPDIADIGQGGLLDIMLHPDFANNQTIFFSYAAEEDFKYGTQVARAELSDDYLENLEVIFTAEPKTGGGNHFGSRLLWGPDDKLYITLGEKFQMEQAQDTSNHLGSVIRINPDGSVPQDNPFIGQEGFRPEIFTYGHRNPQGIFLHPVTRDIWIHEHGPRGGDEINILKAGANYGWPKVTYGVDYSGSVISNKTKAEGIEPPILHWTPSIAPSGMEFYTGSEFPEWRGNVFVGALVKQHLRRLELKGDEVINQEVLLSDFGERIRDVAQGPDGYLYILTDSVYGGLYRLEPAR